MTIMALTNGETVTISIRRPTETPAIYVAGTFSNPEWEPLELSAKPVERKDADGNSTTTEYLFSREVELPEGQYQYRFREGSDGPWFHDEDAKHGTKFISVWYSWIGADRFRDCSC